MAQENPPTRPYQEIDPRDMLATVEAWFEAEADRQRIRVENPARLYGFE